MRWWKQTLSLAVALAVVNGCSGHLSRSNAKNKIEDEIKLEQKNVHDPRVSSNELLTIGRIDAHCFDQNTGISSIYDPVEGTDYKALAQAGFITVKSLGTAHSWEVSLTDTGKGATVGDPYAHKQQEVCDYWQVNLPLAKWDAFTITGIQEDGVHARADIVVIWKLTPLGLALKKEATKLNLSRNDAGILLGGYTLADIPDTATYYFQSKSVLFDKYDDGWRIREFQDR